MMTFHTHRFIRPAAATVLFTVVVAAVTVTVWRPLLNRSFQARVTQAPRGATSYGAIRAEIADRRTTFEKEYRLADAKAKQEIVERARERVYLSLTEAIFPAWYGTRWAYDGTTETPRVGRIACGYFVATTLRDAGFLLPRTTLAQQPAETIIRNLTGPEQIKRFRRQPLRTLRAEMERMGRGVYVIGLDTHVGFIVHDGRELRFVHSSSQAKRPEVVSEPLDENCSVAFSDYRVLGKILDDAMIERWIEGKPLRARFGF